VSEAIRPEWPATYPDATRPPTKLFLIDDGGERWWVSAHSPERALGVLCDQHGGPIEEWDGSPPDVREVTQEDVPNDKFTFEDGEKCRLWNAFQLVRGFEVMLATTLL
jgi:hypothetical protein